MSSTTPMAREAHWAIHFAEKARAYWTEDRTQKLVGNKRLAILPGDAPVLLRALGLLHRDASMPPEQVRKFRQINHMVALLKPSFCALFDRFSHIRLLDAACGRSYLSTLLAWDFQNNWPKHEARSPVQILGVDRSEHLVESSRRRAEIIGLSDVLQFATSSLADLDVDATFRQAFSLPDEAAPVTIQSVVSLHGCDTATDDAIALGVNLGAEMIAVVPCCQAELAQKWATLEEGQAEPFETVHGEPHLRRSLGAHVTDVFRLQLIRSQGYRAAAIEFVPAEHTAKNTLIRAVRTGGYDADAMANYRRMRAATGGVGIALENRLLFTERDSP